MLDTQLILVEGVMGSGKSTLTRFIVHTLRQHGYHAKGVNEADPHPTYVFRTLPHWQKIWLDVTPETFIHLSYQRWATFVQTPRKKQTIFVFDGQFFHGDLTSLMIADTPQSQLVQYIDGLVDIIRPCDPILIYLYQADVAHGLARTADIRGDRWVSRQVNWKVDSPYCVQRNYVGIPGWMQLYRDYRTLTDQLYARFPMRKCAIENSAGTWQSYEQQVCTFLNLGIAD